MGYERCRVWIRIDWHRSEIAPFLGTSVYFASVSLAFLHLTRRLHRPLPPPPPHPASPKPSKPPAGAECSSESVRTLNRVSLCTQLLQVLPSAAAAACSHPTPPLLLLLLIDQTSRLCAALSRNNGGNNGHYCKEEEEEEDGCLSRRLLFSDDAERVKTSAHLRLCRARRSRFRHQIIFIIIIFFFPRLDTHTQY